MFLIKPIGIALVVLSCTVCGFLKSKSLASKHRKLCLLLEGTNNLYNYIESGSCELKTAVIESYLKCEFITCKNNKFYCADIDLKKENNILITSFLNDLGTATKKIECERINNFKLKLNILVKQAEDQKNQKCKVYQSLGICIGLTLGILLI